VTHVPAAVWVAVLGVLTLGGAVVGTAMLLPDVVAAIP
jgi:hypothetical protein